MAAPTPPQDPIYRMILAVLVFSAVGGALVMLVGHYILGSEAIVDAGTGLALLSAAIYFFFRWLGKREARRRQDGGRRADPPDRPGT